MIDLTLQDFKVGDVVITPCKDILTLTEDRKYIVSGVEDEWIEITDDTGETRFYQSYLFIETNVYYNLLLYITLMRLFEFED